MNRPCSALAVVGTTAAAIVIILASTIRAHTPSTAPAPKKYQARPPATQPFGAKAFDASDTTTVRWTGNAGFFVNSRGTTFMIDPLLQGFDMPIMIDMPILPKDVPRLDAVLVTHSDNDHYSIPTLRDLAPVTKVFHSTTYVSSLMKTQGWPASGHSIGDVFTVGPVRVTLTPADHAWQNSMPPREGQRHFSEDDACGFRIETPDGVIWHPGDSRLMPQHLTMEAPDAILFDFSDNEWHFGLAGAAKLANAYPDTPLLLSHWGTVNAPDFTPFNGDPAKLAPLVVNPERIRVLAPGEPYVLTRLKSPRRCVIAQMEVPVHTQKRTVRAVAALLPVLLCASCAKPHGAVTPHAEVQRSMSQHDDVRAVSPALERYSRETLQESLWKRPHLSPRDRSLVTVAALIARNQTAELADYIDRALQNGVHPSEISEVITHLAFYSGWGNAMAAVPIARAVFERRGMNRSDLPPASGPLLPLDQATEAQRAATVQQNVGLVAPGLVEYTRDILFRELWLRPALAPRDRSLVTVSALIAASQVAQVTYHLNRAMDHGLTKDEAGEVITHLAFYAGWPNAFSAVPVAKDVFETRQR